MTVVQNAARVAVALALLVAPARVAAAGDSAETSREQEAARQAAAAQLSAPARPWGAEAAEAPSLVPQRSPFALFAGVDDTTVPAERIDVETDDSDSVFDGYQVWGAAYDHETHRIYFVGGTVAYRWTVGGGIELMGTVTFEDAAISVVSLAFHDGKLYGTRNIGEEAVYEISLVDGVATIWADYDNAFDFGGLAFDPRTGYLYGTNDGTAPGLYRIHSNGTTTLVTAYPVGASDLDGLAIGRGRAYLVPDEPGSIHVWDLDAAAWQAPLTSPWPTSETFSGATFIENLLHIADFELYPPDWSAISPAACSGQCGVYGSPCACDFLCVTFGDCCLDACATCGHCP